MNRSPWKATPAVGFSQVSKVGRGSCSCRSASTARHSDLASGSACMLLSQTGILSVSSPPGSYSGRCLSALSPGLAWLRSSAALAALAFFSCRVHSPRFRLYQWMALLMSSHLPLIQGQNSRVSRSTSSSACCDGSGGGSRSGAIAVSRLSSSWLCDSRQFGSDAGGIVFAGPGRLVPEGLEGAGSVRGWRG